MAVVADLSPPKDAGSYEIPLWLAGIVVGPLCAVVAAAAMAIKNLWKDREGLKNEAIAAHEETINAYKANTALVEKQIVSNEKLKSSVDALAKAVDKLER